MFLTDWISARSKGHENECEENCAQVKTHLWMTDCQSLSDYLVSPAAAVTEDKRLEIDLESLRESLWDYYDGRPKDDIHDSQTDKPRWIDASTMLCDPLTKSGAATFYKRLRAAMYRPYSHSRATLA